MDAGIAAWQGSGIRREMLFFSSASDRLFGSVYAAASPRSPVMYVICPPWGPELLVANDHLHGLAAGLAREGLAAMIFHWPGQGDSGGPTDGATMDRMREAVLDAVRTAADRFPALAPAPIGVRLGACVAALAAPALGIRPALLVDPWLDPASYLLELQGRTTSDPVPSWLVGSSIPSPVAESVRGVDRSVVEAGLRGAEAVRFSDSPSPGIPETICPGSWWSPVRGDRARLFRTVLEILATGMSA